MDLTFQTFSLAFGLGLLGFIEPCTIGAHLIFVNRQLQNPSEYRLAAVSTFILTRVIVMAGFGGAIVMLGQMLIGVQTGFWLVFGVLYLALGLFMIAGFGRICAESSRSLRSAGELPEIHSCRGSPLVWTFLHVRRRSYSLL